MLNSNGGKGITSQRQVLQDSYASRIHRLVDMMRAGTVDKRDCRVWVVNNRHCGDCPSLGYAPGCQCVYLQHRVLD